MGDFGIGAGELLLILVVVLIIFGPGKIPEIARGLGKTVHAFRKASSDLSNAVSRETEIQEKHQALQKRLQSRRLLTQLTVKEKHTDPGPTSDGEP